MEDDRIDKPKYAMIIVPKLLSERYWYVIGTGRRATASPPG
jgi:hypothetical protein